MKKINVNLLNAYANAYDLTLKKKYSTPKIYSANGDLTKRWYVYFSFRNPKTNVLERQTPIYGGANNYKTKEERLEVLNAYRRSLISLLEKGLSPYEDNSNVFKDNSETKINENKYNAGEKSIEEAFSFGLKIKEQTYKATSFPSFKSSINKFQQWLADNSYLNKNISFIDKKLVNDYLNFILMNVSARTRNNTRTYLSSLFRVLEDNEIIRTNFIKNIPLLNSVPERHKTYSSEQELMIFNYLEEKDNVLLLFIKFITYAYLRPIEVCRLRVGDIDIMDMKIRVRAKNSPIKIKILPKKLYDDIRFVSNYAKDSLIFTPNGYGKYWEVNDVNRRDYFTRRFRKVKDQLDLGKDYGLYSFRHTSITNLYNEFIKQMTPNQAKNKLMLITGHKTMDALEKYLRNIDAILPDDYSEFL